MFRSDDSVWIEVRLVSRRKSFTVQRCWHDMYVVYRRVKMEVEHFVDTFELIYIGVCTYLLPVSPFEE